MPILLKEKLSIIAPDASRELHTLRSRRSISIYQVGIGLRSESTPAEGGDKKPWDRIGDAADTLEADIKREKEKLYPDRNLNFPPSKEPRRFDLEEEKKKDSQEKPS